MINYHQELIIGNLKWWFSELILVFLFQSFADKYRLNGKEYRTLTKMYGLRFVLTITGNGGRFDLYYLFLSVGKFWVWWIYLIDFWLKDLVSVV